jgi:SAM-dependent methyltransferase
MTDNTKNILKTTAYYNANAGDYTSHVRDNTDAVYHHYYEKPAMYNLLPKNLKGMRVLSLGCGSGEDCSELQKRGASVTGIDLSEKLIEQARSTYPESKYIVGNMEDLSTFSNSEFDLVYSSLAVHYLHDWSKLLNEVHRVLKPHGVFQFSMGHPIRMGMSYEYELEDGQLKGIGRVKNKTSKTVIVIGDYFAQGPTPALGSKGGPVGYGKTFAEIVSLSRAHGFVLADCVDPQPLEEMSIYSPNDYQVLKRIPEFCIYVLTKSSL